MSAPGVGPGEGRGEGRVEGAGLLLLAASGLAREVLAMLRATGDTRPVRVLDDDPRAWGQLDGVPVVGGLGLVEEFGDHQLLVCAGAGRVRRRIVQRLAEHGVDAGRYTSVLHPGVDVPPGCEVGDGSIVLAGVVLTAGVHVGRHVVAMPNVTLTHDVRVGDFATLCAGVSLGGGVRLGEGCYLGMNASLRQGVDVGADAVLGMGAALLEDLPAGQTWAGVPAGPVRRAAPVAVEG